MSGSKMTLGDLLAEVGYQNCKVQILAEALEGKQSVGKDNWTRFRFVSEEKLEDVLLGRRTALVVWADTDALEAARKKLRAAFAPISAVPGPATAEQEMTDE